MQFELNWNKIQLRKEELKIDVEGIENQLITTMMHGYGFFFLKFQKDTYVKKHLCIILQMVFNILFGIVKTKYHKKDLLSAISFLSLEFHPLQHNDAFTKLTFLQ